MPCACHAKGHLNVQKWSVPGSFFAVLTWKCASRHNGVRVFDIATSKSAPNLACFVHFDFEMCFAPQWRATFHLSSGQMAPHPPLSVSRLCYLFSTCIFCLLPLSLFWSSFFFSSPLWLFPPLLFHLSILSEVWLLNFLRISIFFVFGVSTRVRMGKSPVVDDMTRNWSWLFCIPSFS